MGRLVRVRGAGAVRVAGDELLAFLAFVVHRVAQRARDRHHDEADDKADATRRGLFAARKRGAVGTADDQGEA